MQFNHFQCFSSPCFGYAAAVKYRYHVALVSSEAPPPFHSNTKISRLWGLNAEGLASAEQ